MVRRRLRPRRRRSRCAASPTGSTGCDASRSSSCTSGCLGVIWTGASWFAVWAAVVLYFARMAAVTGVYHRYFSHKTYSTSRPDAVPPRALRRHDRPARAALVGLPPPPPPPALRRGRRTPTRPTSTGSCGRTSAGSRAGAISRPTIRRCATSNAIPELVFLNRFDAIVPAAFAAGDSSASGALLHAARPGPPHQRLADARLGLLHQHDRPLPRDLLHQLDGPPDGTAPLSDRATTRATASSWRSSRSARAGTTTTTATRAATRNGFYWWEIDITYYLLRCLSWTGLIWGLKAVPDAVLDEGAQPRPPRVRRGGLAGAHAHAEHSSLKRIVPAAAAIAVATVNAANPVLPRRPDGPRSTGTRRPVAGRRQDRAGAITLERARVSRSVRRFVSETPPARMLPRLPARGGSAM